MFCYQKNFSLPTEVMTREQFWALVRAPQTARLVSEAREARANGDTNLYDRRKKGLPLVIFVGTFDESEKEIENKKTGTKRTVKGRWRVQKHVCLNGLVVADYDHLEGDVRQIWEEAYNRLSDEEKRRVVMVFVTPSGHGLKVVFTADVNVGNLIDNQLDFSAKLGLKADESCKDGSRGAIMTTADDILLIDEERLFTYENPAFGEKYNAEYRSGRSGASSRGQRVYESTSQRVNESKGLRVEGAVVNERTRFIAHGVMKEKGLEPQDFIDEGGRHTTVKMFLSGATQLLTKEELNGVLGELMPDHWNDPNIQQLVNDFYQNYTHPSQRLLKYQEQLFTQSRRLGTQPADTNSQPSEPLPQMPGKLPRLIELLTSRTPEMYRAAVANAVFPALATHTCGVRFCYTDNVEHEATLMNCLMAGTGVGKGCIDEPIRHIMADIKRRDDENIRREAEWKKDCQRKGANKDKMVRPEGLVIQIIDPDMTKPALVTRMDEAEGHFVYVKLNELDLFEQLKGQTGKQHFQLMCLAFDPGAEYGQTRVGVQSVTARPVCRFNWNACTTILKGRRFFNKVLTDGPISRINFCTIPEMEIGSEQPVYGLYDAEFDEAIKPYIDNLTKARGLIDCKQAFRLAKQLQQECAEFARLSQNEVYWNLSHRACVIAWLKACVLYVANGRKWERCIEDFARWSLQYDMWCKMLFFGEDIEKANMESEPRTKRGPRNLLELLPDEFTKADARRVRQLQGLSNERGKCQNMISTWKSRGYVVQMTDDSFKKCQ